MVDLTSRMATELIRMFKARETTPSEVLEACIARISALNPLVNAITATDFARARIAAEAATARYAAGAPVGPLDGIPIGVKDLQDTAGLLTTYGARHLRGNVPGADSPWIARLRRAGAIVVAKTNVPEMGAGGNTRNPVWGATGNPFDPNLTAGGSSGGSAAALALDLLPLCTGSDTGGSLRLPAAFCGVIGFRPTANLVANGARTLGWSNLSVLGPMARSMDDLALFLRASLGPDPDDPLSLAVDASSFDAGPLPPLGALRVGHSEDFGGLAIAPEVRAAFRDRIASLAPLVASCEAVDLALGEMDSCFDTGRAEAFVAVFEGEMEVDEDQLSPAVAANLEMARGMTLQMRARAHLEQTRLLRRYNALMRDFDIILTPTAPVAPFAWSEPAVMEIDGVAQDNYYRWLALTYRATLLNCPALTLPTGKARGGMPFGLQMLGKPTRDADLIAASRAIEHHWSDDPLRCRPLPDPDALRPGTPALTSIVTHPPIFSDAPVAGPTLNVV